MPLPILVKQLKSWFIIKKKKNPPTGETVYNPKRNSRPEAKIQPSGLYNYSIFNVGFKTHAVGQAVLDFWVEMCCTFQMKSNENTIPSPVTLAARLSLQMFPAAFHWSQEAMFWWLSSNIIIKTKWIIIVLMNFISKKISFLMLILVQYERENVFQFHFINQRCS